MKYLGILFGLMITPVLSADTTPSLGESSSQLQSIVVGAGCFWGVEKRYEAMPGVVEAVSGYSGGNVEPSYRVITSWRNRMNPDNHAEVVQITFDAAETSLETLLKAYFEMHDPTQGNRQGNDIGTQYRSIILTTSDAQSATATELKNRYQIKLTQAGFGEITTTIEPLEAFYPAEEYHQDYIAKNPDGYCPDHSTGVRFDPVSEPVVDNTPLQSGKHIVVIDARFDCPYCEAFKRNVVNDYQGMVPLHLRFADQLQQLRIETETSATPTIIFLEDGIEVASHRGYLTPEAFYEALGRFQLDDEAYDVAFNSATDPRFCEAYDRFKTTPDGVFIDALSGAPLFDTRDRFNSGTGWLSFTQSIDGAVTEHDDYSLGMYRIELKSASSGMHLGHKFDDGPDGMPRYCINATVLEFRSRDE
jgi:peptide methionine sulfoxide reductase msrA/msrB